ncbi:MAG: hypothetical protein KJ737_23050 [Proteobacteria bacterium]|nr:hypothetical protein [Pseudomonadota bacterium]
MIETVRGNRIIFDGIVTLTRPVHECKFEKPDEMISFTHRNPLIRMSVAETRLTISGLKITKDAIKIEIMDRA